MAGNLKFLILQWIRSNFGSHILAIVRRSLTQDWVTRYKATPALIGTFVEIRDHTTNVYRTSDCVRVGTTQGRGCYVRDQLCG